MFIKFLPVKLIYFLRSCYSFDLRLLNNQQFSTLRSTLQLNKEIAVTFEFEMGLEWLGGNVPHWVSGAVPPKLGHGRDSLFFDATAKGSRFNRPPLPFFASWITSIQDICHSRSSLRFIMGLRSLYPRTGSSSFEWNQPTISSCRDF